MTKSLLLSPRKSGYLLLLCSLYWLCQWDYELGSQKALAISLSYEDLQDAAINGQLYSLAEEKSRSSPDDLVPSSILATEYKQPNRYAAPFGRGLDLVPQSYEEEIYVLEDKDYPRSLFERYPGVGQVSGIATLPNDDVAIVHRLGRDWNEKTFNSENRIANLTMGTENLLIKNDTIMILDRENGTSVTTLGSDLFSMPHSITSDPHGNLWISDVGRHQVMRLPTSRLHLKVQNQDGSTTTRWLPGNLTRIWPDIILGEAFVPGQDQAHFCKPSEIVVSPDGELIFVADGYCNQRILVFASLSGKYLGSFGEDLGLNVVHSLAIMEDHNLICAADRENGRILCFKAGLDGDLESMGKLMLTVIYPLGKVFAITTIRPNHLLVSSNQIHSNRFDLASLNPFTRELKQIWTSTDLMSPHSLASSKDGRHLYAADMSRDAYRKVFKFDIIRRRVPVSEQ